MQLFIRQSQSISKGFFQSKDWLQSCHYPQIKNGGAFDGFRAWHACHKNRPRRKLEDRNGQGVITVDVCKSQALEKVEKTLKNCLTGRFKASNWKVERVGSLRGFERARMHNGALRMSTFPIRCRKTQKTLPAHHQCFWNDFLGSICKMQSRWMICNSEIEWLDYIRLIEM